MFQIEIVLNPEMITIERMQIIREAFNRHRSQMTLMRAHKLSIPE